MTLARTLMRIALGALLTTPLAAQRGLREVSEWGTGGVALAVAVPVREMREFVDAAGGMDAFVAFNLGRRSPLALRLEGAFLAHQLSYDLGVLYVDIGSPFYGPGAGIGFRTSSASFITSLRAGPQLTLGTGPVRLYGVLLGGVSYFATTRSVLSYDCGCGYYYDYWDSHTLSGDVTLGWETGGGLQVRLGRGHKPVLLDLGARFVRHADARYLGNGPVVNGARLYQPVRGPAEMVVLRIGLTTALR